MAEFSGKEASGAVILLTYMSGKLQGLRANEIYYRSSAALSRSEIPGQSAGVSGVSEAEASVPKSPSLEHPSNDSCVAAEPICMLSSCCSTLKMRKLGLKGRFTCIASSALILVTATPANSQQATAPAASSSATQATAPQPKPAVPNTLMDGTPVRLRLGRTISSASERVGNSVDFEVAEDIKINNFVVIPVGAVALATVTAAEHKKHLGRAGTLELKLDTVRLADGEKAAITATEGGQSWWTRGSDDDRHGCHGCFVLSRRSTFLVHAWERYDDIEGHRDHCLC